MGAARDAVLGQADHGGCITTLCPFGACAVAGAPIGQRSNRELLTTEVCPIRGGHEHDLLLLGGRPRQDGGTISDVDRQRHLHA